MQSTAAFRESRNDLTAFIGKLSGRGAQLWAADGQLHYKAPKGTLTPDDLHRLRALRGEILAVLEERGEPTTTGATVLERAPLSYAQLAHWNMYEPGTRGGMRQLVSATRLHGRLNVSGLQESIAEVIRHHDALRVRIVTSDKETFQRIAASDPCCLEVEEIGPLEEAAHEAAIGEQIRRFILQPIDFEAGPLFGARLVRLRDEEHVLILGMSHMISDAFSRGLLLRDVLTSYSQVLRGKTLTLPSVRVQFPEYALWQRSVEASWLARHRSYWDAQLSGCTRAHFPVDEAATSGRPGWGFVPLKIGREPLKQLMRWSRMCRTTVAMNVFAAYVAMLMRWCDLADIVVRYQSDGREAPELQYTIGYFASILYLRATASPQDTFLDLTHRLAEVLRTAQARADHSYLSAQIPCPGYARNPAFNWIPQRSASELRTAPIRCTPVRFTPPLLGDFEADLEPMLLMYEKEDEVSGGVYFPLDRFALGTMERFSLNFMRLLHELPERPDLRIRDIPSR